MASKFIFLHSANQPENDFKTLDVLGSVLFFRDTYLNQTYSDVFAKYDVVIMDIDNAQFKSWYSSYKTAISNAPHIKCVFLYHAHVHIDEKVMHTLRNEWKVDSIIKELPKVFANRDDLINKLVNNMHLPKLNMPVVESCLKTFFLEVGKKIGCVND